VRPLTAPSSSAQHAFRCTVAGTSTTEPGWSTANNSTCTSGPVTFQNVTGQSTYNWNAPAGNIYSISNNASGGGRVAAGDRVFVSSDHTETQSTVPLGTSAVWNIIEVISVNRAGSVPPVQADITSGAAVSNGSSQLQLNGQTSIYFSGFTFSCGEFTVSNGSGRKVYLKNCTISLTAGGRLDCATCCKLTLDNSTFTFASTACFIGSGTSMDVEWINTPSAIGGSVPTTLFVGTGGQAGNTYALRGIDLSALTTTLYNGSNSNYTKVLLDSCRIASGLTRFGTSYNSAGDEVELVNCYDGTNIVSERHTPAGDVTTNRSTTLVGGAQDDVGLFSHQMVSSTRSDPYSMTLDSFWMDVEMSAIGVSRTATVEIVSSASLNNNDIRLQLEYLGTSGSSLASFGDSLASPLTATAALPTSTATWNSPPSTPVYQHIQVTFTPNQAGRLRGLVRLGKVSTTVYVNPQITVT
jgi:hypothetical protein